MEPADTSLDGQDWSEHLGGLKPKSLTRSVDNLEGQQHRVTETNAVILMQISLIFFPPSKVAFWFERNQDQSKKKKRSGWAYVRSFCLSHAFNVSFFRLMHPEVKSGSCPQDLLCFLCVHSFLLIQDPNPCQSPSRVLGYTLCVYTHTSSNRLRKRSPFIFFK